jgi:hypothetical protein
MPARRRAWGAAAQHAIPGTHEPKPQRLVNTPAAPGLGANLSGLLDSLLVAKDIARTILQGFDRHFRIYREITRGARSHYIHGDWAAGRHAVSERISLYD